MGKIRWQDGGVVGVWELKGFQDQSFSTSFSFLKGIAFEQANTICAIFCQVAYDCVHIYLTAGTRMKGKS